MTIRQQFFAYLSWHINPNLPGREIEPDAVSKEHFLEQQGSADADSIRIRFKPGILQ
jgi:hypothetical protein